MLFNWAVQIEILGEIVKTLQILAFSLVHVAEQGGFTA